MSAQLEIFSSVELDVSLHNRQKFCCGVNELDMFLREKARKESAANISKTFVICLKNDPSEIVGYYSLASNRISVSDLPDSMRKKLPKHPFLGVTLLGRLAVSESYSRAINPEFKFGETLLTDAKLRAYRASRSVASYAMVVDVLVGEKGDPSDFYRKYDFVSFPDNPKKMFLSMETIGLTLRSAGLI
ncbi:MAG: GNAT family N-acetyltransferase [Cyanobacteria bacterium REEB67]|nr:GNAT family N-acetyltransferase [Cyanobacteria bacterium REEB67]